MGFISIPTDRTGNRCVRNSEIYYLSLPDSFKKDGMNRICLTSLFFLVLLSGFSGFAQERGGNAGQGFDSDRLFFGGNFAMRFGNNSFVNISPQVGYQFNDHFAAGGGVNFITSSYTVQDASGNRLYRDSYGYAGLNAFARVFPISMLFASIQPEYNYSWGKLKYYNGQADVKSPGVFVPVLLAGVGAALPAGRGRMIAMLQYDIIHNSRSPYGNKPFVTFGFNF
jgi:hypothetical protein